MDAGERGGRTGGRTVARRKCLLRLVILAGCGRRCFAVVMDSQAAPSSMTTSPTATTSRTASTGCARVCWAPTTASSPSPRLWSASPVSPRSPAPSSLPVPPAWSAAPSRWPWANVSVSSQKDSQQALIEKERRELEEQPEEELEELAAIYQGKGLSADTARTVARELTAHDALGAHLSAELQHRRDGHCQPVARRVRLRRGLPGRCDPPHACHPAARRRTSAFR